METEIIEGTHIKVYRMNFEQWVKDEMVSPRAIPAAEHQLACMLAMLTHEVMDTVVIAPTDTGGIEFTLIRGGARASVEIFSTGALAFVNNSRTGLPEHWLLAQGDHAVATSRLLNAVGLEVASGVHTVTK